MSDFNVDKITLNNNAHICIQIVGSLLFNLSLRWDYIMTPWKIIFEYIVYCYVLSYSFWIYWLLLCITLYHLQHHYWIYCWWFQFLDLEVQSHVLLGKSPTMRIKGTSTQCLEACMVCINVLAVFGASRKSDSMLPYFNPLGQKNHYIGSESRFCP